MQFCPNCGKRLIYNSQNRNNFCIKCGHEADYSGQKLFNNRNGNERVSNSGLVILDRKVQSLRAFPRVNVLCQKCGGKIAETWTMTFGSEENSQATFFRCVSCGYTQRQID